MPDNRYYLFILLTGLTLKIKQILEMSDDKLYIKIGNKSLKTMK